MTTVYVGASAELVRGFITTPLERAIAAADGIDYIESQSSLGLSTINVRLKLNYDPIKALAEISSKVDQVRDDLPPEAEVPVINIESADSQFAPHISASLRTLSSRTKLPTTWSGLSNRALPLWRERSGPTSSAAGPLRCESG